MASPAPKDVVIAVLGASAGLGGLVLVFLGLVIADYQGIAGDAPKRVKNRAKRAGPIAMGVFALSVASMGFGFAWLAAPGGDLIYHITIWVFVAELIALFVLAAVMTWKMLS
jgi:hypothetical protein